MSADREPTAPEVLEWRRDDVSLPETDGTQRSFQHTEPRKIEFRSEAQDISKKVNSRLEILRTSTNPGQLNDFHTVRVRALAQHVN